jgi:hypothetical protein
MERKNKECVCKFVVDRQTVVVVVIQRRIRNQTEGMNYSWVGMIMVEPMIFVTARRFDQPWTGGWVVGDILTVWYISYDGRSLGQASDYLVNTVKSGNGHHKARQTETALTSICTGSQIPILLPPSFSDRTTQLKSKPSPAQYDNPSNPRPSPPLEENANHPRWMERPPRSPSPFTRPSASF